MEQAAPSPPTPAPRPPLRPPAPSRRPRSRLRLPHREARAVAALASRSRPRPGGRAHPVRSLRWPPIPAARWAEPPRRRRRRRPTPRRPGRRVARTPPTLQRALRRLGPLVGRAAVRSPARRRRQGKAPERTPNPRQPPPRWAQPNPAAVLPRLLLLRLLLPPALPRAQKRTGRPRLPRLDLRRVSRPPRPPAGAGTRAAPRPLGPAGVQERAKQDVAPPLEREPQQAPGPTRLATVRPPAGAVWPRAAQRPATRVAPGCVPWL